MSSELVLVIDPSRTIHRMVDAALSKEGYTVAVSGTAEAAMRLLRQQAPRLVLLETAMPGLDSSGVYEILGNMIRGGNGPVILLLSADAAAARATAEKNALPAHDVLVKPFAAKALKVAVGKVISLPVAEAPAAASPPPPPAPAPTAAAAPVAMRQQTPPPLPPRTNHPPAPAALPAGMPPPPTKPRQTPTATSMLAEAEAHRSKLVPAAGTPPPPPGAPTQLPPAAPLVPATQVPTPIPDPVKSTPMPPQPPAAEKSAPATPPRPGLGGAPRPSFEFDCPAALVSGREALVYINHSKLTGLLTILREEEAVQVYFKEGLVRFLTSDNPTIYMGEMTSPWKKTAQDSMAAYEEQVRTGKPFVITLNQKEVRLRTNQLSTITRRAGEEALVRGLFSRNTRLRFQVMEQLPEYVESFPQEYSLLQLLLLSYRAVRSWQTVEKEIAHSGVVVNFTRYYVEYAAQLDLSEVELRVVAAVDGERSIAEMAQVTGCSTLEVGAVLYGFIRLGLIAVTHIPDSTAEVSPM